MGNTFQHHIIKFAEGRREWGNGLGKGVLSRDGGFPYNMACQQDTAREHW